MEPSNQEPTFQKNSIIGIANLGNTCFMNATVQALRHFPEVAYMCTRGLFTTFSTEAGARSVPVARSFAELVQSLQSGSYTSGNGHAGTHAWVMPRGFYEMVQEAVKGTVYSHFAERTAQDAHEFMVWLLDQLYMATAEPRDLPWSVDIAGSKEWADAFRQSYSPLTELFFGQLQVRYKCMACETVHKRYETFNCLKVQPLVGRSWAECIEEEILAEELIEGYACEVCERASRPRANAEKSVYLMRLPKLLILTVKRYTPYGGRINTPIVHDNCDFRFQDAFSADSNHSSREHWYSTIGIVDHLGFGMGGGHYVAQGVSPIYREWWMYDDEGVRQLKEGPVFGAQTYMVLMRAVK
jgi:ubiquitin C-terminal hydrolase